MSDDDLTMASLLDIVAAMTAERDQANAAFGEALGAGRPVPLDALLFVSPDVGMRMTREGERPAQVRISWMLPPGTILAVNPAALDTVTTAVTVNDELEVDW